MKRSFILLTFVFACLSLHAQGPASPEEMQQQLYEAIDKEIENNTNLLKLEDWQIFMIDSTLTHDLTAMHSELMALSTAKVSNSNAYISVQDKWSEAIYQSYMKILTPAQQAKYLKSGAGRAKKARDKRAEANEKKKK